MIRTVLCSFLASGLLFPLYAGTTMSPGMDPAANIDVEVESWLEACPRYGLAPLELRIRNGSKSAHTWTIRAGSTYGSGMQTEARLTVEPESSGRLMVYAPATLATDNAYYYGSIAIHVDGPGVHRSQAGNLNSSGSSYGGDATEFIAMGKKISAKGWSALRDRVNAGKSSSSGDLMGSEVDTSRAPEDWRGYSGLAQFWLEASEWQAMDPKAKAAVMDWVSLGGRLYVLNGASTKDLVTDVFPMLTGTADHPGWGWHGSGTIEVLAWDGNTFPLDEVARRARKGGDEGTWKNLDDYDVKWTLKDRVGQLTLRSGLIFGFILVFGVLIGPVNLFWLAGASRRHRLFWTTPAIALAGSGLLVVLMVLQDGTGGTGSRFIVATLMPQEKRMALVQEQVARTGVLLGSSFPVTEPLWMMPLDIDSENAPIFGSSNREGPFMENPEARSGDWFASRSVQAHLIQTVRPSRAVVEFQPATDGSGAPTLTSSVEVPLKKIFIVDEKGLYWVAEDVGTGEKKGMRQASQKDFRTWMRERTDGEAGPVCQKAFGYGGGLPGCIYAEAAESGTVAVPTLPSIRWKDDRLFILGKYVKRA